MTYRWPITPVLITRVFDAPPFPFSDVTHRSTAAPIASASSIPPFPVTALAQPELITIARRSALFLCNSTFRLTTTGAAWNLFLVKTAAAEHGVSDAMIQRSGELALLGLTPTCVPLARKPLGYIPLLGTYFCFAAGIAFGKGAEYCRDWVSPKALRMILRDGRDAMSNDLERLDLFCKRIAAETVQSDNSTRLLSKFSQMIKT
jgi:hypothetical protein